MATQKVLGWGALSAKCNNGSSSFEHNDIVENSADLSVQEGEERNANIEGGEAEATKKAPDKYILTYQRRIPASEVSGIQLGFAENIGDVEVVPDNVGAVGVKLKDVSRHTAVKFDSTDGAVLTYTYKTKGKTNAQGELTDVEFSVNN